MTKIHEIFGLKAPKPWALKSVPAIECANPERMIGLELEVEGCTHGPDWYIETTQKYGWRTTEDGSLRGSNQRNAGNVRTEGNAFEFISKPMTTAVALYALDEFLKVTQFGDANYSDRTSVHVHVNCQDLTVDQVSSVALLYMVVESILFQFVGKDREHSIYCVPWTQCRMNYDMVTKMAASMDHVARHWQKYTALNLLPLRELGTIEFRHMHGTADYKKLETWINLIGSMFKYGEGIGLGALIDEIKTLNSTSEYEAFFNRVLGGYLPYNDAYRHSMESGVIVAKYSLMNWKKPKKDVKNLFEDDSLERLLEETAPGAPRVRVPTRPTTRRPTIAATAQRTWDQIMGDTIPVPQQAPQVQSANRFIPWPPTGVTVPPQRLTDHERRVLFSQRYNGIVPSWTSDGGAILILNQGDLNHPVPA